MRWEGKFACEWLGGSGGGMKDRRGGGMKGRMKYCGIDSLLTRGF